MANFDINKIQRKTFLETILKVLTEINEDNHKEEKNTYEPKVVESLAIATALQKQLPISSSETNVELFFNQQYNIVISTIINEINEHHSIAWRQAIDYTKKIWRIRYYSTFPREIKNTYNEIVQYEYLSFYDILLDTPQEISLEDLKLINTHCKCKQFSILVSTYSSFLDKFFTDLNQSNKSNIDPY